MERKMNTPPYVHRKRRNEMDASDFKRKQLRAIERRKQMKRLSLIALCILALIMFVAVVMTYLTD